MKNYLNLSAKIYLNNFFHHPYRVRSILLYQWIKSEAAENEISRSATFHFIRNEKVTISYIYTWELDVLTSDSIAVESMAFIHMFNYFAKNLNHEMNTSFAIGIEWIHCM